MTDKEKAQALIEIIEPEVLDCVVAIALKDAMEFVYDWGEEDGKKMSKAIRRVHNYFTPPDEHLEK